MTFRALEAGAVAVVEKPCGAIHPDFEETAGKLIQTVKNMAEIKVVRRWTHAKKMTDLFHRLQPGKKSRRQRCGHRSFHRRPTGAADHLRGASQRFSGSSFNSPAYCPGFIHGLVEWLTQTTGFPVRLADHGEVPLPGQAYFAPDGFHLGVARDGRLTLGSEPPVKGLRPSVAHLFRSASAAYGAGAAGVLLTGMGSDGADELKLLKEHGAMTIVQDKESSVVHGMPGQAIKLGAATYVLTPK